MIHLRRSSYEELNPLPVLVAPAIIKNKVMENIYTNNKGKLEVIYLEPFEFLRGIKNKNKLMGMAKDSKGREYFIYPARCNLTDCFCRATAEEQKRL